ncbi:hypothetical protein [Litoribacillus peritrichatus]|uniref:Lipoprotein n=1 Tax=Litoribacillus peritrichatus TaxID=718191 RepID=A0ABP7MAG7_9GAMM
MSKFLPALFAIAVSGCTTLPSGDLENRISDYTYPKLSHKTLVSVGDPLVEAGNISESTVLVVRQPLDGFLYDIPANSYPLTGSDDTQNLFSAKGVGSSVFTADAHALALSKEAGSPLCVVDILGGCTCYHGRFEAKSVITEEGVGSQKSLIYQGKEGDKIQVQYLEQIQGSPVVENLLTFDLSGSNIIGYQNVKIEVLSTDSDSMEYKLLQGF